MAREGIVAREDAELAVKYGVDRIIVSNHGGHVDASARGTLCHQHSAPGVLSYTS